MITSYIIPVSKRKKPKRFTCLKWNSFSGCFTIEFFKIVLGKWGLGVGWYNVRNWQWWNVKSWLLWGGWGFHSFEFKVWSIRVLGLTLRLEKDCADQIPENLRGFIASSDTLGELEKMLK